MNTFIVSRPTPGGAATKDKIIDDKIPIYDTEADAEADFANLEEGQIYATKEDKFDVDAMKQYISDENELSDWENITLSTNSASPTEMPYDGFYIMSFSIHPNQGTPFDFYVNGVIIVQSGNGGGNYNSCDIEVMFPVKKGDLVYRTVGNQGTIVTQKIAYYKKRHYEYR